MCQAIQTGCLVFHIATRVRTLPVTASFTSTLKPDVAWCRLLALQRGLLVVCFILIVVQRQRQDVGQPKSSQETQAVSSDQSHIEWTQPPSLKDHSCRGQPNFTNLLQHLVQCLCHGHRPIDSRNGHQHHQAIPQAPDAEPQRPAEAGSDTLWSARTICLNTTGHAPHSAASLSSNCKSARCPLSKLHDSNASAVRRSCG